MVQRTSLIRRISAASLVPALALGVAGLSLAAPTYSVLNTPVKSLDASEIVDIAVTPNARYALIVGKGDVPNEPKLRSVNLQTRAKVNPSFDLNAAFSTGSFVASSVAVHPTKGYAIVTLRDPAEASTNNGYAVFVAINQSTGQMTARIGTNKLTVGVNPESVEIAPNGNYAVVANEGGTISIIDLTQPAPILADTITPGGTAPQPEEVAISPSSSRIFVSIQENSDVHVITIDPTTLALGTSTTFDVPGTNPGPDGLAALNDNLVVTANEDNNSVSLLRYNASANTLTQVSNVAVPTPEMVAIGSVGGPAGVNRAFVTSEETDSVYPFVVTDTGLTSESAISLNVAGQPAADRPEGIALVDEFNVVVTANVGSQNISIIQATDTTPPPPPTDEVIYLPLVQK